MSGEAERDPGTQPAGTRRRELVIAAVVVALGGVIIALTLPIASGVKTDPLGPRAFPLALGAAIGLLGGLLAAAALAPAGLAGPAPLLAEGGEAASASKRFAPGRLVAAAAATAVYVAVFEPLGYLLATPPYVAAILMVHGGASRPALLSAPVVITAGFYAAFRFGLLVPVPDGVLERWLPW